MKYILFTIGLIIFSNFHLKGQCTPPNCSSNNTLNISTGIDQNGNLLTAGAVDQNWLLMNFPPLNLAGNCQPPNISIPNVNVVSSLIIGPGNCPWLNINNNACNACGILSANTTNAMGCANANPAQPWRFRRYFCICQPSVIAINGNIRLDNQGIFSIYDINGNTLFSTLIPNNNFYANVNLNPNNTTINLNPGTYFIEVEVSNVGGSMGYAINGMLTTVSGQNNIMVTTPNCCNNTSSITVQKVIESVTCNNTFDSGESTGSGWTYNLLDNNNNIIQTQTTDQFGEATFSGLTAGTYIIVEQSQFGYLTDNNTQTITITTNSVNTTIFYNCPLTNFEIPSCCNLDIDLERTNGTLSFEPNSVKYTNDFKLTVKGAPIQEMRASLVDVELDYAPYDCNNCVSNKTNWGSIDPIAWIGDLRLEQPTYLPSGSTMNSYFQEKDAIWELSWSGRPTDFSNGITFPISTFFPLPKNIDCCENNAKVCLKLSMKDINCNYCDTILCCDIKYDKDGIISDCIACNDPIQLDILEVWDEGCCEVKLTAVSDPDVDILWSNGSTTREITVSQSGTYEVTASKVCKGQTITASSSRDIELMEGPFPQLIVPRGILPYDSNPINREMTIEHFGINTGDQPAYNATSYRLWVFDRWGTGQYQGAFRFISDTLTTNCDGFINGEIVWDGRDDQGQIVPQGVYSYILELENCNFKSTTHEYLDRVCVEYGFHWFTLTKYCKEFQDIFVTRGIGSVTVVH